MSERMRKVLNNMHPTMQEYSAGDAITYAPVIFSYDQTTAANVTPQTVFTAPFPMRIATILVHGKNAEAAVVTMRKGTTAMATAISAANGALASLAAGLVDAQLVLAAGDIVTMQTAHADSLCRVTVIGFRV